MKDFAGNSGDGRRWLRRLAAGMLGLSLGSCATQTPTADLDEPIFGSSHATTFVVAPAGGQVHVRDLAKVARVLRRYKTLEAAERALVKSSVAKRLQGLIALEVQRVEAQHLAERQQIVRLPDQALAAKRLAELEENVRREATANVIKRLGHLVAVPLKTSDNRSAVAFARISGQGVEVTADAGEIDRPIASLVEGAAVRAEAGEVAAFISAKPVTVAAGR